MNRKDENKQVNGDRFFIRPESRPPSILRVVREGWAAAALLEAWEALDENASSPKRCTATPAGEESSS